MYWGTISLYIFTSCLRFDEPYGLHKIQMSKKYKATLHAKTSNNKVINPLTPVPPVTARDEPWPFFHF